MRSLLLALFVCSAPALALADVPPEPGYIESCRSDWYPGEGCVDCQTYIADETPCLMRPEHSGLTQCCRGGGTSAWSEVWCRGSCPEVQVPAEAVREAQIMRQEQQLEQAREAAEAEDDGGLCSVGRGGSSLPWWALLGCVFIRRRPW